MALCMDTDLHWAGDRDTTLRVDYMNVEGGLERTGEVIRKSVECDTTLKVKDADSMLDCSGKIMPQSTESDTTLKVEDVGGALNYREETVRQIAMKVAVLNTLDKGNVLKYEAKVLLLSCLVDAVAYSVKGNVEVYDRTDAGTMVDELKFQQSGHVPESQVKQIEQQPAADYILVSEIIGLGNKQMLLTAKIINVTTGRIEGLANKRCDIEDQNNYCMVCQQLAEILLSRLVKQ